jgi:S-adenosylmethionine synthetase
MVEIGYTNADCKFNADTFFFLNAIGQQSPDIARGVDAAAADGKETAEQGAGDQGIMFGYAVRETPSLMPAPIAYSHQLGRAITDLRKSGKHTWLRPDSKTQVSMEYVDGKPTRVTAVVVSTQHAASITTAEIREILKKELIEAVIPGELLTPETEYHINPTGVFIIGGPEGDCGLTGRKIIVDTYGGAAPHGGGAFSGKDPTKVDRSAAYAARYVAKNIVAAGLADRCTLQVSYAIGVSKPLSLYVETYGTGKVAEDRLVKAIGDVVDLTPRGIREHLGLSRPIYARTAAYGHFGRTPEADGGFSWERLDLVDALKAAVA